ncbi:penicillin-binding protein activator [Congregibacter brevis]|uniref:Penicillin-binding protein activator n=1 Tax=Congregibacter brevis TaxID=3081201 RepID=A0ABZ0IFR1_9GAMM|nr:penicillin-binding protein activator [Congregibacter sp. IMCC45268]
MLSLPHCWRNGLIGALFAALLSACASTPGDLPDRAGFPGESPAATTESSLPDTTTDPLLVEAVTMDEELFAATRAALRDGDWLAATLALPTLEAQDDSVADIAFEPINASTAVTALWIDYYKARIAYLRGKLPTYESAVNALKKQSLPGDLRRDLLLHELEVAKKQGDSAKQLGLSLLLSSMPKTDAAADTELNDAIWSAAQRLHNENSAPAVLDAHTQGWMDLATASTVDIPLENAAALAAWEAQYPEHIARAHAESLRDAALLDAQTSKLTLVLPLSGPLEKAGAAVSQGFIDGFFAAQQAGLTVAVLDSRRFESISAAYLEAQESGASVIVGPLGKLQVEELLAQPDLSVPVLTLNRPTFSTGPNPSVLLLSLAPEDEARQLAEDAFASGSRRALVIRPEGDWGERMEAALVEHWRRLGGQVPSTAIYSKASTHSPAIRDALGLGDSAQRSAAIRSLFSDKVETAGRRREDLDTVFLLSKRSDEARALKPLINYHYAGDLPVYALSTADSGTGNAGLNRDLGGLKLLAMPWRMTPEGISAEDNSAALHALGSDAYALARRWWRMRSAAAPLYFGLTAELRSTPYGLLERRLNMAEFNRGELRPR